MIIYKKRQLPTAIHTQETCSGIHRGHSGIRLGCHLVDAAAISALELDAPAPLRPALVRSLVRSVVAVEQAVAGAQLGYAGSVCASELSPVTAGTRRKGGKTHCIVAALCPCSVTCTELLSIISNIPY